MKYPEDRQKMLNEYQRLVIEFYDSAPGKQLAARRERLPTL